MVPIAPRSFEKKNGMHSIVSEVYKAFIAVVTVVLLVAPLTTAAEGQGRAQRPSAQASEESPGTADRQIQAQLEAKAQRTLAQRKVSSQLLDGAAGRCRPSPSAGRGSRGRAGDGGHSDRRHAGGPGAHPGPGR